MKQKQFLLRLMMATGLFLFASVETNAQFGNILRQVKQATKNTAVDAAKKTVNKEVNKEVAKANYKNLPEEGKWCIEQLRNPGGMPDSPWCMESANNMGTYISHLSTANVQEVKNLKKMIDARHESNVQIIKARNSIDGDFNVYCTDADTVAAVYSKILREENNLKAFREMLENNISYACEKINVTADGKGDCSINSGSALQIIGAPLITANMVAAKASFSSGDKAAYAEPSQVSMVKGEIQRFANIATLLDAKAPTERSVSFFKARAASMMATDAIATNDPKNKRADTQLVAERKVVSTPSVKSGSAKSQTGAQKKVREYRIEKGSARGYVTDDGIVYDWAHRKLGSLPLSRDGDIKNGNGSTIGKIWNGEIKNSSGNLLCKVTSGGSISEPGSNATVGEVRASGAVERKGKELGRVSGVSKVWAAAIIYCNFFRF